MKSNKKNLILIAMLSFILLSQGGWISRAGNINKNYGNRIIEVGAGGYSSIQDAINNASSGDTIYVHSGVYYENIFIGKKINLIGEHPLTTIIDGSKGMWPIKTDVIEIAGGGVHISNFTIRNGVEDGAGIEVWEHYSEQKITNCIISNNYYGIRFPPSSRHYVANCTFSNNKYGIWLQCCCGVACEGSIFYHNNFINNSVQALDHGKNIWNKNGMGNYWSDYKGIDKDGDGIGDEPYNISGGNNQDNYPFMDPIDNILPLLSLLYPRGGEFLAGNVTIKWNVSDNVDDDPKIDIKCTNGSTWYEIAKGLENSGEYEWDTSSLPLGNYSIKITATDASGNKKSDMSNTFTIISPPKIGVIRPVKGHLYIRNRELFHLPNNATISIGSIDIVVNASSDIGIKKVEFYVDGSLKNVTTDNPYEWEWKSSFSFGKHNLKIIVYDSSVNTNITSIKIWKIF